MKNRLSAMLLALAFWESPNDSHRHTLNPQQ